MAQRKRTGRGKNRQAEPGGRQTKNKRKRAKREEMEAQYDWDQH